MISSPAAPAPTPAASATRTFATNALRKAGLMDRDTRMRDLSDKPGGRKGTSKPLHKARSSHRPRPIDAVTGKDQSSSSNRNPMQTARIKNEAIAIRGAAKGATAIGRMRRNALSLNSTTSASSRLPTVGTKLVDLWRQFVTNRYTPDSRFLNLEKMAEDDFIKQNKLSAIGNPKCNAQEAAVIFKLAGQLDPKPQTISLAHNGITDGRSLQMIAHYLPELANLSLEGNRLQAWRDLEFISGRKGKLSKLRELILIGNPIRELEFKNGRAESYKSSMVARFPSLEMLDQEPVTTIGFNAPEASTSTAMEVKRAPQSYFTREIAPSFITGIDSSVVNEFLTKFLPLFDTQRAALLDVYHPSATFSFSANTSIPPRARLEGFHTSKAMPNQRKLDWNVWINGGNGGSRNLSRLGGALDKTTKTLHIGNQEAVKALVALPTTRHDISSSPDRFCVDAWPVPHGEDMSLFVTLHGQFTELPSEGIRSFDRSFILAPAPEGSIAKQSGWAVIILSDQLNIRGYSSHEAWHPGYMRVQHGENIPTQSFSTWIASINPQARAQLEAATSYPEPERTWILQICHRTGLNVQFAVDCLGNNEWDLERAVLNFEKVKGTLGREAFL